MATITNGVTNGCTFRWEIKNISHCWLKKKESIASPTFIADALKGSKWYLKLYPMGSRFGNDVGFYLCRNTDCLGTNIIEVNFQLAFLDIDGSFLKAQEVTKLSFKKGQSRGYITFELREKVFGSEKEAFLPEDTLTVQCTIWKKGETLCKPKYSYARTVFKVNRRSFIWKIDGFSTLKTDTRYKFKDDLICFDLDLNKINFADKLNLDIISFEASIKYFSFKTFIINSDGEKVYCGSHEYLPDDLTTGVIFMPIFSKMLTESETLYLPNDVLSLHCEYVSSNGAVSYEFCSCGIISSNETKVVVEESRENCIEDRKPQTLPVLGNDLKSLYNDGIFSDIELRTATQTFLAHKIIISARSRVFRRMLCNDMKEINSGTIDITDLESDTIRRMLLYIYTDTLEDMQFENVCKLYSAADKYEILSLKSRCSSFLKYNLSLTKACDVLTLADLHRDDDLKSTVQDFMLKQNTEFFVSQEWKHFTATNMQLAQDVMYLKVIKCKYTLRLECSQKICK